MANNNTVKKKKVKMSTGDKVFTVINTVIMILVCIAIVYPLYYVLLASVTDPVVVSSGKFLLYPEAWYTNGYTTTLKYQPLWTGKHHQIYRIRNADFPGLHHSGRLCTFQIRYGRKKTDYVPVHLHDVLQRRYDSDVLNRTAAAHLQHNMGYGPSGSSVRLQPDRMPLLL